MLGRLTASLETGVGRDQQAWSTPHKVLNDGVAGLLLLALAGVVFVPRLHHGFYGFDIDHILTASSHTMAELMLTAEGMRAVSATNFTPMLGFSIRLDWILSGTNVVGYNVHAMIAYWLVGLSAYAFLRTAGANIVGSVLGAVTLMVAPATLSVSSWICTRHYQEGLIWALLSLSCMIRWSNSGGFLAAALAVTLYLLAGLSKEVYLPLPLAAFLLVRGNWWTRFRAVGLLSIGAVAYLLLRAAVLGTTGGGYASGAYSLPAIVSYLVDSIPHILGRLVWGERGQGISPVAVSIALGFFCASAIIVWRTSRWTGVLTCGVLLAGAMGPVAMVLGTYPVQFAEPVGDTLMNDRFLLPITTVAIVGLAFCVFTSPLATERPRIPVGLLGVCLVAFIVFLAGGLRTLAAWDVLKEESGRQLAFLRETPGDMTITVAGDAPEIFYMGFRELMRRAEETPHFQVLPTVFPIAEAQELEPAHFYGLLRGVPFRPTSNRQAMKRLLEHCLVLVGDPDPDLRFGIRFRTNGTGGISWQFMPADLSFFLLLETPSDRPSDWQPLPPSGQYFIGGEKPLRVRVRAVSRASERGYRDSDTLMLDLQKVGEVVWPTPIRQSLHE